jgi:hypothetical protein
LRQAQAEEDRACVIPKDSKRQAGEKLAKAFRIYGNETKTCLYEVALIPQRSFAANLFIVGNSDSDEKDVQKTRERAMNTKA